MNIFLKYKSKLIFFLIFIIVAVIIVAIIPKDDFPINKPALKITYNNEKVSTINGEYNFQVDGIGDSTHNVSKIFKVYID